MTDTTNSPPATVLRGILVYLVLFALPISTARGDVVIDAGIDRYVQAEMDLNEIPAVALAVVRNGVVSQAAFGVRRIGALEPAAVDTPFDLASVSKSLTAMAIVQLDEKDSWTGDSLLLRIRRACVSLLIPLGGRSRCGTSCSTKAGSVAGTISKCLAAAWRASSI